MINDDCIKIHLNGESVWALRLSDKIARIANLPFYAQEVTFGDEVEYDHDHEVVQVTKPSGYTMMKISYPVTGTIEELQKVFSGIAKGLRDKGIRVEGTTAGFETIAVPGDVPILDAQSLVEGLGAAIVDESEAKASLLAKFRQEGCSVCGKGECDA